MKRMLVNVVLALYALGLIAGGVYYLFHQSSYVQSEIAQVKTEMVPIYPEQAGILSQWSVQEGEQVKKGDELGLETVFLSDPGSAGEPNSYFLHPIASPKSGVLLKSNAVVGQAVKPDYPIAIVADLSNIYILAYIDEKEIDRVKPGEEVDITLDAYKDHVFQGRVRKVGAMAGKAETLNITGQEQTGEVQRVPVQISIDYSKEVKLIPGMNAEVKIHRLTTQKK